ncbi:nucleoside-diphosphate sugar epimerase/dehydratase [Marinobacter bohaiensis]|uniref:nucleoside-diphosphate sugar epimerase/dehydratase n=1 Tax=Marinobacter bohaiensis TaxID=2201898 RepID=UPI000DAC2F03|nr:hypothetical protein [Marinobacter bohaiensis]
MRWRDRLQHWIGRSGPRRKLIVIGIGYPSFSLGQALIDSRRFDIVAFIDDEPWTNRTQLLGTTVRYPSDLAALIRRHGVDGLVHIEGEPPVIADNIRDEALATGVSRIDLPADQPADAQLERIRAALANA